MALSSGWALQRAIFQSLVGAPGVLSALGSAAIFDRVPRGTKRPYVTFGNGDARDRSTVSDRGEEHIVVLEIWSAMPGRRETMQIVEALRETLDGVSLVLQDHHLVDIRHTGTTVAKADRDDGARAVVRFRAVTEAL